MHPHDFLQWNGKEAEGIVVPQVLLFGRGKLCQVFEALDVLRSDARLLERSCKPSLQRSLAAAVAALQALFSP